MNDEQLASDVKRAFGRYHTEPRPVESLAVPPAGVPASVSVARRPLLARRRLLGGLSFAGVAAAVVLAFALSLGVAPGDNKPGSVYAGWQPTPTKNDAGMRAAAQTRCLEGFDSEAKLVVQDQRGPVAMFVFVAHNVYLSCVLVPDGRGGYRAEKAGVDDGTDNPFVEHLGWALSSGPASNLPPEVTIFGTTDAPSVVVRRADGTQIVASVNDGVYLAWWPGCAQAATVVAFDARGLELGSLAMPLNHDLVC